MVYYIKKILINHYSQFHRRDFDIHAAKLNAEGEFIQLSKLGLEGKKILMILNILNILMLHHDTHINMT